MRIGYWTKVIGIWILGLLGSSGVYAQESYAPELSSGYKEVPEMVFPEPLIGLNEFRPNLEEVKDAIDRLDVQALSAREEMMREIEQMRSAHDALAAAIGELRTDLTRQVELTDAALVAGLSELGGDLISRLESSNAEIRTLEASTRDALGGDRAVTEAMQGKIDHIDRAVDGALERFVEVNGRLQSLQENLDREALRVDRQVQTVSESVDGMRDFVKQEVSSIQSNVIQRSLIGFSALAVLLALSATVAAWLVSRQRSIAATLEQSITRAQEDQDKLDLKLTEWIEQHVQQAPSARAPDDHAFFLSVADEINRMSKRLDRMSSDVKDIKPLSMALKRLEAALDNRGYEIFDLLGQAYVDGLIVKPRFVPDDKLDKNQKIITNVIKPQVNFEGKIVQIAEVEVSVG